MKTLIDAAGIERPTANAYDGLLERLLITERIPAWSSNRLNRLVRLPKRYLVGGDFQGVVVEVEVLAAHGQFNAFQADGFVEAVDVAAGAIGLQALYRRNP